MKMDNWEKQFDTHFKGFWRGRAIPDEIKFFIRTLLASQRAELREKVEALKRTDDTQMSHDHVYDEALSDVRTLLKDEK